MTKKFAFLFLAIAIVFSACRKDTDMLTTQVDPNEDGNGIPPSVIVTSSLIGVVTDEYNNVVEGATVRLKSNTAVTDENGNFMFSNVQMEEDGALVTASKAGFFKAYDRVRATSNATSYTRIQLLDRAIISSFPAGAAQDVEFDGATVKFQNNGFVDTNGADYSGTVNVAAHWIDPTSGVVDQQMPGDLRALDAENVYSVLETFGMVAVDLIADNGSELQLKEGLTAEINFPIPTELLNSAPATIPLWSFDEENGYWVEEGSATKVGDRYVGNVTHFSFWNCDAPFPLIEMNGQVVSEAGEALAGVIVCIDFADNEWWGGSGYTNNEGFFGGKIPKNENLILTVKDNCGNGIYTMNIGPFTEDVDLGQITVTGIDDYLVTVSGTLLDCDNDPVSNGYAVITSSTTQFPGQLDDTGYFEELILICESDTEIELAGYNFDDLLQSTPLTYTVSPGGDPIDAGTIVVCDQVIEEYLFASGDGAVVNYFDPTIFTTMDSIGGNSSNTISSGSSTGNPNNPDSLGGQFDMNYIGTGVGTFTQVNYVSSWQINAAGTKTGYSCQGCAVTVNITLDEGAGGYIEGNYMGEAQDFNAGATIPISGEFRILRD